MSSRLRRTYHHENIFCRQDVLRSLLQSQIQVSDQEIWRGGPCLPQNMECSTNVTPPPFLTVTTRFAFVSESEMEVAACAEVTPKVAAKANKIIVNLIRFIGIPYFLLSSLNPSTRRSTSWRVLYGASPALTAPASPSPSPRDTSSA